MKGIAARGSLHPAPSRDRLRSADAPRTPEPPTPRRHYHVYVVKLEGAVLNHAKFRDANPGHDPLKACVYVGMTGLTPEERFQNHKRGHKANTYVQRYGIKLLPHLYARYNPMTFEEASVREELLAERLRRQGFAVWQG